jgi:hypothetical protein
MTPNRSTIAEEIEMPYGREVPESEDTVVDDRDRDREQGLDTDQDRHGEAESAISNYNNPMTLGGLGGFGLDLSVFSQ